MPGFPSHPRLGQVHRWTALALSPVFLLLLLSGAVLAVAPLVRRAESTGPVAPVEVPSLIALLRRVDPEGTAAVAFLQEDRTLASIAARPGEPPATYRLATGERVPTPPPGEPDAFDLARRVHTQLWFGLGSLAGVAAAAMLVLVLVGPLLSRPGRRGVLGLHLWLGWLVWPLAALPAASWVLMKLHPPVVAPSREPPPALADALARAAAGRDLSGLQAVRAMPGGAALLLLDDGAGGLERWVLRPGEPLAPVATGASRLGRVLHEGTWAGGWGGLAELASALVLLGLLGTGALSWWRRSSPARALSGAPAALERGPGAG